MMETQETVQEYVQGFVIRAREAQAVFEEFTQAQVDRAVCAVGKAIYDRGEELAELAVEETGMGIVEDKAVKNKSKSMAIWYKMKNEKSRGVLRHIEEKGLIEVAKPIGVIGAIGPCTNPNMTPMHNAMIALKGGNAIVFSPHPRACKSGMLTCEYMRQALKQVGAPENLIQCIPYPTLEISQEVMAQCDTTLATGGPGVVRAAYASGKPAYGVGAGNVQALIDRDVSIPDAVSLIVKGRTYDSGILCTCEQASICPEEYYDEFLNAMRSEHAFYVDGECDREALRRVIFPGGRINPAIVGQPACKIAAEAGIEVPEDTKLLLVKVTETGADELLSQEKMAPVMAVYTYKTWKEAVDIAKENLLNMGAGHSVVLHSNTYAHIEYAALELPVSRFSINQQGSGSLGGTFVNGLNPTGTLGCGSWGGTATTDNLWWDNLVNISRIAYVIPYKKIPSPDEVWS